MPMGLSIPGLCKYPGYTSVSGATETLDALKAPKYSLGWGGGMLSSGPGELWMKKCSGVSATEACIDIEEVAWLVWCRYSEYGEYMVTLWGGVGC